MNVNWNGYASAVIRDTASDPTVVLENWTSVVAAGIVPVRSPISSECAVQKKTCMVCSESLNSCCVAQYIFSIRSGL